MPKSVFTPAYGVLREEIVAMRKAAGLSQNELATRLGTSQSFVSQVERGVRRLDLIEFVAIAKALNMDPSAAFGTIAAKLPEVVTL